MTMFLQLKSTESSGGKNYSNGDSGFIETGSGVNFKRENSDSTINSDLESVAPQSSVYSADLDGRQGSEMTINSGQFSINSSISSTPLHVGMSGTRLNKVKPLFIVVISNETCRKYYCAFLRIKCQN